MANEDTYFNHRVRLISVRDESIRVEFKVTPTFTENRSVDYTAVTPIHMPGSIQVYKNTTSRTFTIGATLVSRTANEAYENLGLLQTLRAWTLPYFGASSTVGVSGQASRQQRVNNKLDPTNPKQGAITNRFAGEDAFATARGQPATGATGAQSEALTRQRVAEEGVELLGAPPMVLYLYAYSSSVNVERGSRETIRLNVNRVPVVISSLSFTYPENVDYFPAAPGINSIDQATESFPTKMEVTVECLETHSPREYERFNLQDFHNGKLVSF